jgi:H+/Cl- antiporter ClcA
MDTHRTLKLTRPAIRKSLPYEFVAAVLALVGAFALVALYMPVINPGLTKVETHQDGPPVSFYILFTPIPLLILLASWYFNRKAQRLKKDEKNAKHDQTPAA